MIELSDDQVKSWPMTFFPMRQLSQVFSQTGKATSLRLNN
jgi:hypothetical protein